MAVIFKIVTKKCLFALILSIAIVFCLIHGWCNYSDNVILSHRRELIATKFDFTPFMPRHHHRKHLSPSPETEIDPVYGVEKRLVPTGPNPLHH
ncbi:hypothetical protein KY289_018240 [Solanum tuberosum]|nr:hypothetical protein KY289_018240 [Solanum tuberosum]